MRAAARACSAARSTITLRCSIRSALRHSLTRFGPFGWDAMASDIEARGATAWPPSSSSTTLARARAAPPSFRAWILRALAVIGFITCVRQLYAPFDAASRDVAALRAGKHRRAIDSDVFASLVAIDGAPVRRAVAPRLRLVSNVASH